MRQKGRNLQVVSALLHNPEVLLPLEVLDINKAGLEVVFEEEEVLTRGGRVRFPTVEVDMLLEEDLEVAL